MFNIIFIAILFRVCESKNVLDEFTLVIDRRQLYSCMAN